MLYRDCYRLAGSGVARQHADRFITVSADAGIKLEGITMAHHAVQRDILGALGLNRRSDDWHESGPDKDDIEQLGCLPKG